MKREFEFSNGDFVKDVITGFKGLVTGSVYYITGCNQYLITPKADSDNMPESHWLDEDRLILLKPKKIKIQNTDDGPMKQAPIK